jgi:hypothetical protein
VHTQVAQKYEAEDEVILPVHAHTPPKIIAEDDSVQNVLRQLSRILASKTKPTPIPTAGAFPETPASPTPIHVRPATPPTPTPAMKTPTQQQLDASHPLPTTPDPTPRQHSRRTNTKTAKNTDASPPLRRAIINTAKNTTVQEDLLLLQAQLDGDDFDHDDFLAGLEAVNFMNHNDSKPQRDAEPIPDIESDDQGSSLSPKEIERRDERLALHRITQNMKKTTSSIRDARHGIERLEQQVSSSVAPLNNNVQYITAPIIIEKLDPHRVNIRINVNLTLPRLWMPDWRLTWFGIFLMMVLTWFILESVVCAKYCHPTYSYKDTWSPTDPFFPWAIPTKLSHLAEVLLDRNNNESIEDWGWIGEDAVA